MSYYVELGCIALYLFKSDKISGLVSYFRATRPIVFLYLFCYIPTRPYKSFTVFLLIQVNPVVVVCYPCVSGMTTVADCHTI